MRCAECNNGNPDTATNCATCNTPLPGQNFTAAMVRAENLLRESKPDEVAQQLVRCEAELATARLSPLQRDLGQARMLALRGRLYFNREQYSLAEDCARRAINLLDDGADTAEIRAGGLAVLSAVASYNNNYEAARHYSNTAIAAAQAVGNPRFLGVIFNNRGNIEMATGNRKVAAEYYHQALPYAEASHNLSLTSLICSNLAFLHAESGDYAQCQTLGERAVQVGEQAANLQNTAWGWEAIGIATMRVGNYAQSKQALQRALELLERGSGPNATVQIYANLAELAWLQQDYAKMHSLAMKGINNAIGDYRDLVQVQAIQVHAALATQNLDEARRAFERMNVERELHSAPASRENSYFVLTTSPLLLAARADWPAAVVAFEQAIARADSYDDPYSSGQVRLIYATAARQHPTTDQQGISTLLTEAHSIFSELDTVRDRDKVAAMLDDCKN